MHPAYSIIMFTTASGAGYGLLALLSSTGASHGTPQTSGLAPFPCLLLRRGNIRRGES
jgi:DMSO reductase anchor subunit